MKARIKELRERKAKAICRSTNSRLGAIITELNDFLLWTQKLE